MSSFEIYLAMLERTLMEKSLERYLLGRLSSRRMSRSTLQIEGAKLGEQRFLLVCGFPAKQLGSRQLRHQHNL